jgi:hypothetical protein
MAGFGDAGVELGLGFSTATGFTSLFSLSTCLGSVGGDVAVDPA